MRKSAIILFLVAFGTLSAQLTYSGLDTLDRLPHRYYTPEWYADCPAYLADTNDFSLLLNHIYATPTPYTPQMRYVNEYSVDGQIEIKGLMCFVETNVPMGSFLLGDSNRAPEWLTLCQGGAMHPATGLAFPRDITVIDSLRWDTTMPYVIRLPRFDGATADNDIFTFYVYEVYFPTPIVVDSVFYVAGSVNSNVYEESWSSDHTALERTLQNYPTVYGCIGAETDGVHGLCDFCTTRKNRMFAADAGLRQDSENWYTTWYPRNYHCDRFRQITGPMFAIVDMHTLTLNSADPEAGSVSGDGDYPHLSTATATAHPAPGHTFVRWSDGSTDNPHSVQMLGDVRLVAVFR